MSELICVCISIKTVYLNHLSDQLSLFPRDQPDSFGLVGSMKCFAIFSNHSAHRSKGNGDGPCEWRGLAQDYDDFRTHLATWCGSPMFQRHNLGSYSLHFLDLERNTILSVGKTGEATHHPLCSNIIWLLALVHQNAFLPRPGSLPLS